MSHCGSSFDKWSYFYCIFTIFRLSFITTICLFFTMIFFFWAIKKQFSWKTRRDRSSGTGITICLSRPHRSKNNPSHSACDLTWPLLIFSHVSCVLQSASAINVARLHVTTERECVTASRASPGDSATSVRWEAPCKGKGSFQPCSYSSTVLAIIPFIVFYTDWLLSSVQRIQGSMITQEIRPF